VILSYGADTGIIHVPSAAARASEICQDPAGQLVHEKARLCSSRVVQSIFEAADNHIITSSSLML